MSVEILDLAALALTAVFFALLYYLHKKKHVDFGVRTILAVGLGLIVGLAFKGHHVYVAAVGTVYAHVVSAVVIPLLVFSIISSITNLGNSVRLKNIGLKTVFFLVLNTFFASLITLVAGVATNIGHGVQYELATDYTAKEVPTFVDTVISLFPQNLASHWANGEVVPIVVFSILVAISYNKLVVKKPEEVAPFKKFIDAGDLVMGRVVSYVISFTPYAVLSLIARAVSRSSPADLIPLLSVLVLQPGMVTIIFALMLTEWVGMSRIARAEMLKLKDQEFVLASRTLGAGSFFIIFKEVLPNIIGPIITQVMFSIPTAIFTEAFLSFVGLGIPVPQCSLGSLISELYNSFTTHPYQIIPPIVVMSLLMLSFNLLADGLREALDPKMKSM